MILLLLLCALSSQALAQGLDCPDPAEISLRPMQVKSFTGQVMVQGSGTVIGSLTGGQKITLKVLSFREVPGQEVISLSENLYVNGQAFEAEPEFDEWGNRFAVFTITDPGVRNFDYEIIAEVRTDYFRPLQDFDLSQGIDQHLDFAQPTEHIESNHGSILSLQSSQFTSDSELEFVRQVTNWVNDFVSYDLAYVDVVHSSTEVLATGKGVCDEYANLEAALLRAKGIPTKFVVGKVFNGRIWENHAWLKAFVPGFGWMHVDPTYLEAGFVDGSHVIYGEFSDHSQAADKVTFPSNVQVSLASSRKFEPGQDQGMVCVERVEEFEKFVSVDYPVEAEINANTQSLLEFSFASHANQKYLVPVDLVFHKDFAVEGQASEIILLDAFASLEKEVKVTPLIDLAENTFATYPFQIATPSEAIEGSIYVYPAEASLDQPSVQLKNVIPLVGDGGVVLKMEFYNRSRQEQSVRIELEGLQVFETDIPASQTIIYSVDLPSDLSRVVLHVTGPDLDHRQEIFIQETEPLPAGSQDIAQQLDEATYQAETAIEQAIGVDAPPFFVLNVIIIVIGGMLAFWLAGRQ